MSATRIVSIHCDRCGFRHEAGPRETASDVRLWLKTIGWTRDGILDYCRSCAVARLVERLTATEEAT